MSSAAASSSSAVAASSSGAAALPAWSDKIRASERMAPAHLKHNNEVVFFTRTWVSIIGGCCCGILGLTNWSGFMFYLLTALLTTVVLAGKAAFSPAELRKSFVTLAAVTTDGLVAGCMSYVLFWTLLYDIVYVY